MSTRFAMTMGFIAVMSLSLAGCASDETKSTPSQAGMGTTSGGGTAAASTKTAPPESTRNIDRIASGSVEDSLDACMARIPKDASAGQRMVAEQSCRRDHTRR